MYIHICVMVIMRRQFFIHSRFFKQYSENSEEYKTVSRYSESSYHSITCVDSSTDIVCVSYSISSIFNVSNLTLSTMWRVNCTIKSGTRAVQCWESKPLFIEDWTSWFSN